MEDRRITLLWMKDLLEHMHQCHDQLQWAGDGPSASYLTDSFLVNLTECRKLCERLKAEPRAAKAPRLASAGV